MDVGVGYAGVVSMDMKRMNKFIEIDLKSSAAHIQAGIIGRDLEYQLTSKNLTLRHFPQICEHSSLGGLIAERPLSVLCEASRFLQAVLINWVESFAKPFRACMRKR